MPEKRISKAPTKPTSGGARLMASGKRPVTLGLSPEDHDLFTEAAKKDGRPLTQYIVHRLRLAAKKDLANP